jgi:hypothetical protein
MPPCQCPNRRRQGYQEGRISFPPTFKFEPGPHSRYSPARTPAWTDRVLWRTRQGNGSGGGGGGGGSADGGAAGAGAFEAAEPQPPVAEARGGSSSGGASVLVRQLYYGSVPSVTTSDHKPVVAVFEVAIGSGGGDRAGSKSGGGGGSATASEAGSEGAAPAQGGACGPGCCVVM